MIRRRHRAFPIAALTSSLLLGALLPAVLPPSGCAAGDALLLDVSTPDGPLDQYDLIIRDAVTKQVVVRTGWSSGKTMKKPGVLEIGLTVKKPGNYQIVLVGLRGNRTCLLSGSFDNGPADAGPGDPGAQQYFWAAERQLQGDVELTAAMSPVPFDSDADCDVFPDASKWSAAASYPSHLLDCNDREPRINPFAIEACGAGVDEDCDGVVPPACADTDGDGDPDCYAGADPGKCDCKPMDPAIHHATQADPYPESANCCGYSLGKMGADGKMSFGAPLCHAATCDDGIDQNCDGKDTVCAHDQDCDSYLAAAVMQAGCSAPPQSPGGNDCNDCDPAINPGASEICDKKDNNCNGQIDETCVSCDLDGDGYQRLDPKNMCPDMASNLHPTMLDCNDDDRGVFPGSASFIPASFVFGACTPANAAHNVVCAMRLYCVGSKATVPVPNLDCSTGIMGCPDPACDVDGDGFVDGSTAMRRIQCDPMGKLVGAYDCNDKDHTIFTGAPEKCDDGIDQDCDGQDTKCASIKDADGDHYGSDVDCDDGDAQKSPWAVEICDGKDNDCDGLIDENNPDATGKPMGSLLGATKCTDSNVGDCGVPPGGHCVCSASPVGDHHFEPAKRVSCPSEPKDPKTAGSQSHCYFAPQPAPEVCDGRDNDCNADKDNSVSDDLVTGGVVDCPGPAPMMICCGAAGQKHPVTAACKNPGLDPDNCNGCNIGCSNNHMLSRTCGLVMNVGTCNGQCLQGYGDCNANKQSDGCEINLYTDIAHCGSCNLACSPSNVTPHCSMPGVCDGPCGMGFLDCDGNKQMNGCEINGFLDPLNCGGCTTMMASFKCSNNHITMPTCIGMNGTGTCNGSCDVNFDDCNGNKLTDGCETSLLVDPLHCGSCNLPCSGGHIAMPTCNAGKCDAACDAGYADCDANKQTNGCEISLLTDVNNCGGCSVNGSFKCSSNNITPACTSVSGVGTCTGACAAGFADCNGNKLTDGCETNIALVANCGGCGNSCSGNNIAVTHCGAGKCDGACNAGYTDCDANKLSNGCEINTAGDVNNCGGCSVNNSFKCSASNIPVTTCVAGVCSGACAAGYADCDLNKLSNGCEIDTTTSVSNCGGCAKVCSANHMQTNVCVASVCSGVCAAGFGDCNGNKLTDGCEVSLLTDPNNCMTCGTKCSGNNMAAVTCGGGVCNGTCNPNFGDCDGNKLTNGCESNLLTDALDCSGCGTKCSSNNIATPACAGGVCSGACNAGFADCNGNKLNDGCEVNTNTDAGNCGACAVSCLANNAGHACVAGACGCNAPADCNTTNADTCSNHACKCGGNAQCGAGTRCLAGSCVCDGTSCPSGCCKNGACNTNSVSTCGISGGMCTACDSKSDTCAAGVCKCGGGAACGVNQKCVAGACTCDATACGQAFGCCQGATCQMIGNATCNVNGYGGACADCSANGNGHVCIDQFNGSSACQCNVVGDCPVGKACPNNGNCTTNCQFAQCNGGCCSANVCVGGTTNGACGSDGFNCSSCSMGKTCKMSSCQF